MFVGFKGWDGRRFDGGLGRESKPMPAGLAFQREMDGFGSGCFSRWYGGAFPVFARGRFAQSVEVVGMLRKWVKKVWGG